MPVRKLIVAVDDYDRVFQPMATKGGLVELTIYSLGDACGEFSQTATMYIDPEDVPALCAQLRAVAKLAMEAPDGTR